MLRKTLSQLLQGDAELIADLLAQKKTLAERARRLFEVLSHHGWKPLKPQGGLFLTASPVDLLGKKMGRTVISEENVADLLRERTGIVINTPGWTGIPGYFRFVLSVPELEFEEALAGLRSFAGGIDG
jgi:hypothetical protein